MVQLFLSLTFRDNSFNYNRNRCFLLPCQR